MTLAALQHLIRAAQALADGPVILVLGSASLLASFPDLGNRNGPLASTYDADLCPDPFDELTATMLDEALGENSAYFLRHGYHADILRDSILMTLPFGWRERLIPIPDLRSAMALEPHDLAAVKLRLGRIKDLSLLQLLHQSELLDSAILRARLDLLDVPIEQVQRLHANFRSIIGDRS